MQIGETKVNSIKDRFELSKSYFVNRYMAKLK